VHQKQPLANVAVSVLAVVEAVFWVAVVDVFSIIALFLVVDDRVVEFWAHEHSVTTATAKKFNDIFMTTNVKFVASNFGNLIGRRTSFQ
jgi:hypothetical protein